MSQPSGTPSDHEVVPTEKVVVYVMHHPDGIKTGCIKCHTIHAQGEFAIGIKIGNKTYLIDSNPPKTCCGDEKKVPLLYEDEALAAFASQGIADILKRDGDTSNLRLLHAARFI